MRSIGYARPKLRRASDQLLHFTTLAAIVVTIAAAITLALRIRTEAQAWQVSPTPPR
jgi:hypothetical protein